MQNNVFTSITTGKSIVNFMNSRWFQCVPDHIWWPDLLIDLAPRLIRVERADFTWYHRKLVIFHAGNTFGSVWEVLFENNRKSVSRLGSGSLHLRKTDTSSKILPTCTALRAFHLLRPNNWVWKVVWGIWVTSSGPIRCQCLQNLKQCLWTILARLLDRFGSSEKTDTWKCILE